MKTSHSLILVGALSLLGGILARFNPFAASLSVGVLVGWTLLIVGLIELISVGLSFLGLSFKLNSEGF